MLKWGAQKHTYSRGYIKNENSDTLFPSDSIFPIYFFNPGDRKRRRSYQTVLVSMFIMLRRE